MKTGLLALVLIGAVSTAQASTIGTLDLLLRVDSIGFTGVEISENGASDTEFYDFLDVSADVWELPIPLDWFVTGQIVPLTATLDGSGLSACSLGGNSCIGAFGDIKETSFAIGDGASQTSWGDFMLSGGLLDGDTVQLDSFDGVGVAGLGDEGLATWRTFAYRFTVVPSGAVPEPAVSLLAVVPVPAAMPLLLAGLGVFGLAGRRKRRQI